jgi:hypothetical protein
MSTIELVFRIASAGAIGVACLALYFWRTAYGQLLQHADRGQGASERLRLLAGQLSSYQRLVVGALAASVAVQLLTPIIDRAIPQAAPTRHPVTIKLLPDSEDAYVGKHPPTLSQNGVRIDEIKGSGWRSVVEKESFFLVDILTMRDHVRSLEGLNQSLAKEASRSPVSGESGRTALGF